MTHHSLSSVSHSGASGSFLFSRCLGLCSFLFSDEPFTWRDGCVFVVEGGGEKSCFSIVW